jgi:hypothetical protein
MTRGQRRFHAFIWPLLALIMLAVFAGALAARAHVSHALAVHETR